MLLAVVLVCASVILAYAFFAYQDAINRSVMSISQYMEDEEYYLHGNFDYQLFVMEMPVTDMDIQDYYFDDQELLMSGNYMKHKDELKFGTTYLFAEKGYCAVYMPMPDYIWPNEYSEPITSKEAVLVYCNITYLVHSLLNNMLVFSSVVAAVLVIMFIASRFAVNKLNRKDEEMKNFFANASHELKTPLMSIRGNADGIKNGYVPETQGYEVIEKEVDRMSELISGILDISKLDSGAVKPEMLEMDVREIIYDAASSLLSEASKRGIRMDVDLPRPVFRECDEAMLYSAFSNILSNAVRYAESVIDIKEIINDDQPDKAVFRFENDGAVITQEDQKHIFDRFYKGSRGQCGIGMALAQEYVRLHGSVIKVSVENDRTVFSVEL